MYDLTKFSFTDMVECGLDLCKMGLGAETMEFASNKIVKYFYEHLIDNQTGTPACTLIRCFKTYPYGKLDAELGESVCSLLGYTPPSTMQCLTLLATVGDQPEWNSRHRSEGHKAIPLESEEVVAQSPMISQLLKQFGLDVGMLIKSDRQFMVGPEERKLNIFHVPVALGSSYIPAQESFVIPFGIKSVLGFGGFLPSGSLFAIIMFSKVSIPRHTAEIFKTLAQNVRIALLPFDGKAVFAQSTQKSSFLKTGRQYQAEPAPITHSQADDDLTLARDIGGLNPDFSLENTAPAFEDKAMHFTLSASPKMNLLGINWKRVAKKLEPEN